MSLCKKENIEKLILTVQKYPIMYDMTLLDFKDIRKKDYTWEKIIICPEMNGEKGNLVCYLINLIIINKY